MEAPPTEVDIPSSPSTSTSTSSSTDNIINEDKGFIATTSTSYAANDLDIKVERPAVVHETIRKDIVEEIQPVIHREIEVPEVHRVIQPVFENQLKDTVVVDKTLDSQYRATFVQPASDDFIAKRDRLEPSTTDFETTKTVIEKEPIVVETRTRKVVEEIVPVVHREVIKPEVIRERLDIYEKVIESPVYSEETRPAVTSDAYPGIINRS